MTRELEDRITALENELNAVKKPRSKQSVTWFIAILVCLTVALGATLLVIKPWFQEDSSITTLRKAQFSAGHQLYYPVNLPKRFSNIESVSVNSYFVSYQIKAASGATFIITQQERPAELITHSDSAPIALTKIADAKAYIESHGGRRVGFITTDTTLVTLNSLEQVEDAVISELLTYFEAL